MKTFIHQILSPKINNTKSCVRIEVFSLITMGSLGWGTVSYGTNTLPPFSMLKMAASGSSETLVPKSNTTDNIFLSVNRALQCGQLAAATQ